MSTIRPRGDKFQAIVRVKKAGVLVHSESRMFDTERLAKSWADRVESEIARLGVAARKRGSLTLNELIQKYIAMRNPIRPLGKSHLSDLDLLSRYGGTKKLEDLTVQFWTKFAVDRRAEGAGPATILHNLSTAAGLLGAARPMLGIEIDAAWVDEAVTALHRSGHVAKSEQRERRVSVEEIEMLVREFRRIEPHPSTVIPMHLIVPLAVALPRRREELCKARWDDYTGRTLLLRDTKHPKRPRNETIPVPPAAAAILDALPRTDARILPYKPESITAAFVRAVQRLGIRDLRFHDLRHEGISRLFEQGLAIQEVSMISGHISWNTLKRYTHLQPKHVWEKLNAGQQEA